MVKYRKISKVARLIFVLILCLTMLFFCVAPGFAVVASAGVIVPVVLAAMSAFGIGTLVQGMTSSQVVNWLSSELDAWASSLSDTIDHLIPLSGIATNPLGALTLLPSTAAKVVTFVRWLVAKHNVVAGGASVPVVSSSAFTNQPLPVVGTTTASNIKSNGVVLCKYLSWDVLFASTTANTLVFRYPGGSEGFCVVSSVYGGYAGWASDASGSSQTQRMTTSYTSGGQTVYYNTIRGIEDKYYGSSIIPQYSSVPAGLAVALQLLVSGPSSMSLVPEGAIDYPAYEGDDENEMPYVVDWGGSPGMTVQDAADEILDRVSDNDLTTSGSVALDPDNVTWPDIVTAPQVPGLDDVFPFCVPFDVYHFFQAFVATPEAPRWEVPFVVPGLVNYTFVIDLSQFNTVAQIFRTMELLCFCIGLALATRRIIRG